MMFYNITYVTILNISACAPGGMECSNGLGPVISLGGAPNVVKGDFPFDLAFLIFGIFVLFKNVIIINYLL